MNHLRPSPRYAATHAIHRSRSAHAASPVRRQPSTFSDTPNGDLVVVADAEGDMGAEDDPTHLMMKERWAQSESRIDALFLKLGTIDTPDHAEDADGHRPSEPDASDERASTAQTKRPARKIEDDYGDDDDEDEDDSAHAESPLHAKGSSTMANGIHPPLPRSPTLLSKSQSLPPPTSAPSQDATKSIEDVRKKLEEDKKAAEETAKRSFHTMFFTLESDRDAMLEQQKLDELDRQVENELGDGASKPEDAPNATNGQGSLSSADLGASSLTLKNLIARIDARRNQVQANDAELRHLISEVRKGRSKWASEDKVGQEELYEAAEKVLSELKAMTEYSTPFLAKVNKRDAPDYHHIIKEPMDIGSMIKKLKSLSYKSKADFVRDLKLIWDNCLKYNNDPNHPLRKKALYMRKETDKLVPLIPDVTVRDRAEVEAEERRNHGIDNELDGGEDSDDDQPIMASRGRKAPSKSKKGPTNGSRDTPKLDKEGTPINDQKPGAHASNSNLRNEFLLGDSDAPNDHLTNGFATPPPGNGTPFVNGTHGTAESQADSMEVDSVAQLNAAEEVDEDDAEFKTWKQITKKDRAMAASDRHKLFRGDQLNADEPALLRSKAGMRRWARQQKQYMLGKAADVHTDADAQHNDRNGGETLAEGIEKDQDRTLPDYYEVLTSIPDIVDHLKWEEDDQGNVVQRSDDYLRLYPAGDFTVRSSKLVDKMEANLRQIQTTRKVCAKIGYVKQLQIQYQSYQNQFAKYDPQPFVEQDIPATAVSEDGPIMAPWVCRAAFQRTIGKMFYHAGFEDFQPAALDVVTDIAADFFTKLVKTFSHYADLPKSKSGKPRYTAEEQVLHALYQNGLDLDGMDAYVKEDMDRLGTKLGVVHERLKSHFADIFRPALGDEAGQDGVGAFRDGSEQFVGGDFAEDIDEDFFGFRELGLMDEFNLGYSVPLHLLHNRLYAAHNASSASAVTGPSEVFAVPDRLPAVSTDNLPAMIGLAQDYFASRLAANNGRPLTEDDDLPPKQRFPKPRLGPAGKISSPRKRPLREQQQAAKKKRKLEELGRKGGGAAEGKKDARPIAPLKLAMPGLGGGSGGDPEKDGAAEKGLMSPESIVAA